MPHPEPGAPSSLFEAERSRLGTAMRFGPVLDLACGRGRHALAAAALGAWVIAMDRKPSALRCLDRRARSRQLSLDAIRVDLETSHGIPLTPSSCAAILVFRFLFRPLAPAIERCLRPGGLLLYETFTLHQRDVPHGPNNPAFLLHDGELPGLFPVLDVLSFEEGWTEGPHPEALASLVARKPEGQEAVTASGLGRESARP